MACFDKAMDAAFASLDAAAKVRGARDGRERLALTLSRYLSHMLDELNACVVLMEENALAPRSRALVASRDRFERALQQPGARGHHGSIVPCDPKLAVFVVLGAMNWVPKWFRHDGDWSAPRLTGVMTAMFERMLSTAPVRSTHRHASARRKDAGEGEGVIGRILGWPPAACMR